MYNVEVRFAENGHFNTFQGVDSVYTLTQLIMKEYQTDAASQRLISKMGHLITLNDSFDNNDRLKKTFVEDDNPDHTIGHMTRNYCIYVYDIRKLRMPPEPMEE